MAIVFLNYHRNDEQITSEMHTWLDSFLGEIKRILREDMSVFIYKYSDKVLHSLKKEHFSNDFIFGPGSAPHVIQKWHHSWEQHNLGSGATKRLIKEFLFFL